MGYRTSRFRLFLREVNSSQVPIPFKETSCLSPEFNFRLLDQQGNAIAAVRENLDKHRRKPCTLGDYGAQVARPQMAAWVFWGGCLRVVWINSAGLSRAASGIDRSKLAVEQLAGSNGCMRAGSEKKNKNRLTLPKNWRCIPVLLTHRVGMNAIRILLSEVGMNTGEIFRQGCFHQ